METKIMKNRSITIVTARALSIGMLMANSNNLVAMDPQDRRHGEKIIEAAARGDIDAVRAELKRGISVDTPCLRLSRKGFCNGATALCYAAGGNHEEIAHLLLSKRADPNGRHTDIFTPLHHAAGAGHPTMVKRLLEAGANPNRDHHQDGTPLHIAASAEVVEALLTAKGIHLESENHAHATPLHETLAGRNWERAKRGTMHDWTQLAERRRMADMPRAIQLLIKAGANPDKRDGNHGMTALHMAVLKVGSPAGNMNRTDRISAIRALVTAGADPEACGGWHHGEKGPYDNPRFFEQWYKNPPPTRHECHTPLYLAAASYGDRGIFFHTKGSTHAVRILLELGAQMAPEKKHGFCRR